MRRWNCTRWSASLTSLIPPLTGYRGRDCSSPASQCESNPCDPEGSLLCEGLENTYRCVCQHGYTGPRCSTPINRCADGLCQHGSVCVDLPGGFKCDCLPGGFTVQLETVPPMNHVHSRHTPGLMRSLVRPSSPWESNLFGLKQQHITSLWNA